MLTLHGWVLSVLGVLIVLIVLGMLGVLRLPSVFCVLIVLGMLGVRRTSHSMKATRGVYTRAAACPRAVALSMRSCSSFCIVLAASPRPTASPTWCEAQMLVSPRIDEKMICQYLNDAGQHVLKGVRVQIDNNWWWI